ncbi:protein translocase subunit SecD [Steroidobacter agaridevorans]|uniref:protein translocase subunit SecD n=1 Tax=Steroidobacter agaridevorans TaxID=2695856 RepID=UPI001322D879|nr:protein translocase subunit SecD [Steroidobacter agaridevorans]GFE88284.1 protein translocase subunit SecDF [Steroidobacter agaridevorans]
MVLSKWRLVLYGLIILIGSVIALPSLLSSQQLAAWPDWLPSKQVALGLDLRGGAHLVLEIDERALQKEIEEEGLDANAALARRQSALQQSIEIVRRRIDAIGVAEPTVQALGTDRILVQLPGLQDPASIRTLLGSTAKLTFHRVESWSVPGRGTPRIGTIRVPAADEDIEYILQQRPMLQGERLVQANASFDSQTAQPVVSFRFDDVGAKEFAKITTENVGRQFAIVLDGKVISAPRIQEPIVGGSGQITGNFTAAETSSLSALLRAGALPVPLQIIQEGMVGPDLGSDAIRMGAVTGAAGLLLVLAFMTVLYRGWGVVANLALVVNVFLTLAALTLLGVTLTLPGIAGIVLGIGLAVDANVLINERIREETRNGKSAVAALTNGFQRAYATIIDSNVTALIATALLFWLGSGPVQGFAVTMALGIAISMFTAVAVVKAIMSVWVRWRRPKHFVIGSLLPARWRNATPNFQFMRARFIGLGVSLVLSVASVVLFIKPGLNYGVDFTGGTIIEASAPATMQLADLRAGLERADLGEVSLQQANADGTTILVRIQQQPDAGAAAQTEVAERAKAAILEAEPAASFDRVDIIGPKVSGELTDAGILAVLFASVAMFIYIWIRFDWHFAVGAIATLVLDTTKVIGFFALTGLEFNLTAIAAVLTLIGYSVNDKVVVYDRMRENLRLHPDVPLRQIIDRSINETLARSIFTSVTAFLAMVPMALWGGATVASFAVPMVFGIVVAASSSVFIAAPILLFLGERIKHRPMVVQEATP